MLASFPSLLRATVIRRPSAVIKSPYVADIRLDDGGAALCHTPGLGAGGYVEAGQTIYVAPNQSGTKTQYTTYLAALAALSTTAPIYIGIHPYSPQYIPYDTIVHALYPNATWEQEVTVGNSRFDFRGTTPTQHHIYLEIKTVITSLGDSAEETERYAAFPVGYKRRKGEVISPRALKHVVHLTELVRHPDTHACVLLFLIARFDCRAGFTVNPADKEYYRAVVDAVRAGVQVRALALDYQLHGIQQFKEVPVWIDLWAD